MRINRHTRRRIGALLRKAAGPGMMAVAATAAAPAIAAQCVDYDKFYEAFDPKIRNGIRGGVFCPNGAVNAEPDRALQRAFGDAMRKSRLSGADACGWCPVGDEAIGAGCLEREAGAAVGYGFKPSAGHYLRFRNYNGSVWFRALPWDDKTPTSRIVAAQRKALDELGRLISPALLKCMNPKGEYADFRLFPATVAPGDPPLPFGYGDGQQPESAVGKIVRYGPEDIAALAKNLGALVEEAKRRELSAPPEPQSGEQEQNGDQPTPAPPQPGAPVGDDTQPVTGDANGEESGSDNGTGSPSSSEGLIPGGAAWLGDLFRMILAYFGLDSSVQFGLMALAMLAPELLDQIGQLADAVSAGLQSDSLDSFMSDAREIFMLAMAVGSTVESVQSNFGGVAGFNDALKATSNVLRDMPPQLRNELEKTMGVEGKLKELAEKTAGFELPVDFDFTDPNLAAQLGKVVRAVAEDQARKEVKKFLIRELDLERLGISPEAVLAASSGLYEGDVEGAAERIGVVALQGLGSKAGLSPTDVDDLVAGKVSTVVKRRGREIARKELRELAAKEGLEIDVVSVLDADNPVEEAGMELARMAAMRLPPTYRQNALALVEATASGDGDAQRKALEGAAREIAVAELARHIDHERAMALAETAEAVLTGDDPVAASEAVLIAELARNLDDPSILDDVTSFDALIGRVGEKPEEVLIAATGANAALVTLAVQFARGNDDAMQTLREKGMSHAFELAEELGAEIGGQAVAALQAELRRHPDLLRHSATARCLVGSVESPEACLSNMVARERTALRAELGKLDPSALSLIDALIEGDTDGAASIVRERAISEVGTLRRSLEEKALDRLREAIAELPADLREIALLRKIANARRIVDLAPLLKDGAAMARIRADIAVVDPALAEAFDALQSGNFRQMQAVLAAQGRQQAMRLRREGELRALEALHRAIDDAPPDVQLLATGVRGATTLDAATKALSVAALDDSFRTWLSAKNPSLAKVAEAARQGDSETLKAMAIESGKVAVEREAVRHLRRLLRGLPVSLQDNALWTDLMAAETTDDLRAAVRKAEGSVLDDLLAKVAEEDAALAALLREAVTAFLAGERERALAALAALGRQGVKSVEDRARRHLLDEIKAFASREALLAGTGLAEAEDLDSVAAIVSDTLTCEGTLGIVGSAGADPSVVAVLRAGCDGRGVNVQRVADTAIRQGETILRAETDGLMVDALHDVAARVGLPAGHPIRSATSFADALAALRTTAETADKLVRDKLTADFEKENPALAALFAKLTAAEADHRAIVEDFVREEARKAEAALASRLAADLRRLSSGVEPVETRAALVAELDGVSGMVELGEALRRIGESVPDTLVTLHPDFAALVNGDGAIDPTRLRTVAEAVVIREASRAAARFNAMTMERLRDAIGKLSLEVRHPFLDRLAASADVVDAVEYVRGMNRAAWIEVAAQAGRSDPALEAVLVALASGNAGQVADTTARLAEQAANDAMDRARIEGRESVRRWLLAQDVLDKAQIETVVTASTLDDLRAVGRTLSDDLCTAAVTDEAAAAFCKLIDEELQGESPDRARGLIVLAQGNRAPLANVEASMARKGLERAIADGLSSAEVVPDAAALASALVSGEQIDVGRQVLARLRQGDALSSLDPTGQAILTALLTGGKITDVALNSLLDQLGIPESNRQAVLGEGVDAALRASALADSLVTDLTSAKPKGTVEALADRLAESDALPSLDPETRTLLATWITGGDLEAAARTAVFQRLDLGEEEQAAFMGGRVGFALRKHLEGQAPKRSFTALLVAQVGSLTVEQGGALTDPGAADETVVQSALAAILGGQADLENEVAAFLNDPEGVAMRLLADRLCANSREDCDPERQATLVRLALVDATSALPGGMGAGRDLLDGDPRRLAIRLQGKVAGEVAETCHEDFGDVPHTVAALVVRRCTDFAALVPEGVLPDAPEEMDEDERRRSSEEKRAYVAAALEEYDGADLVAVPSRSAIDERRARIGFYERYGRYREACTNMDGRDGTPASQQYDENKSAANCARCDAEFAKAMPNAKPGEALSTHDILSLENDPMVQCLSKF